MTDFEVKEATKLGWYIWIKICLQNIVLRVVHTFKFLPLQVNIRSSFSMFWPEVKLLGCYFHFSQLMWKRVKGDVYCVCQLANWTKIHLFVFDDDLIIEAVFSWFWSDCFIRCRICKRLWEKGWLRSLRSDDLSFAICTSRAAGSGSSKNQW